MSDKRFDKILQDKLKGHQVKLGGPNWADMEKILNEVEQADSIDREVRNRLQNHTVEYKESHWQILKNKLELEKRLKEKIYLSKVAEFSILALLLFSVFHFNQQNGFETLKSSKVNQLVSKLTANADVMEQPTIKVEASNIDQIIINHNSKPLSTSNIKEAQIGQTSANQSNTGQISTKESNSLAETPNVSSLSSSSLTSSNQPIGNNELKETPNKEIISHPTFGPIHPENNTESVDNQKTLNPIHTRYEQSTINDSPILNPTVSISHNYGAPILEDITRLNQSSLSSINGKNNSNSSKTSLIALTKTPQVIEDRSLQSDHKIASQFIINSLETTPSMPMANLAIVPFAKTERWIGAMIGTDINLINRTSNSNQSLISPDNFAVSSTTYGVNYSTKKGKNEFFSGVGYSRKFYDPRFKEVLDLGDSYYTRTYTLEQYDIIHIPAQYKRHLGESHKIHAYVFGGLSMNFVIYSDFEQKDKRNSGQTRLKQDRDQIASADETRFPGLLEGGYYKRNIYLTADAGVGVEKQLNRTKIFFESQYKRNLFSSNLGPRKVQLSSLSFNVGTKYRI